MEHVRPWSGTLNHCLLAANGGNIWRNLAMHNGRGIGIAPDAVSPGTGLDSTADRPVLPPNFYGCGRALTGVVPLASVARLTLSPGAGSQTELKKLS
jgi:hypothetical protein